MRGWGAGGKWQKSFCTSNELSVLIVSSQVVIAIWTGKSSRGWVGLMQSLWCPSTIDSKTERSVATWREERRLEGQVTWKLTSAFHLLSILWSFSLLRPLPSLFSSSLPSSFFPLRWILVLDLRSLPTLSLCLFPLAFSLPALLPWLQHHPLHEVHLQRTGWWGGERHARVI